jgi:hypothetical protein
MKDYLEFLFESTLSVLAVLLVLALLIGLLILPMFLVKLFGIVELNYLYFLFTYIYVVTAIYFSKQNNPREYTETKA